MSPTPLPASVRGLICLLVVWQADPENRCSTEEDDDVPDVQSDHYKLIRKIGAESTMSVLSSFSERDPS